MASNKSLNAACNLNGYLFCKMPVGALEVEVKAKTIWGNSPWFKTPIPEVQLMGEGQRCHIRSRKRKAPCKMTNIQTEDNASETDVPTCQEFGYPPQIFTDPTCTAAATSTESEGEVEQESKFLGKYCDFCNRCGKTHCWCNSSDWEEELINVDNTSSNPSIERSHLLQLENCLYNGLSFDIE